MGGNYKTVNVPNLPSADRIPADAYLVFCEQLKELFSGLHVDIIKHVREKKDFGDIDILVESSVCNDVRERIKTICWKGDSGESYTNKLDSIDNSYICTMKHRDIEYNVQIDIIPTDIRNMELSSAYFAYNDLGNLIGRIAHRRGMKYGHDGLWYIHNRGDRRLGEVLLSGDVAFIIDYLGFDYSAWERGFDTFDEMFKWVVESRYFEQNAFPLEFRNHRSRVRDSKRKVYNAFLRYIKYDGEYIPRDSEYNLIRLKEDFPFLEEELNALDEQDDLRIYYKNRINGNIVRDFFNGKYDGKDLGRLMTVIRNKIPLYDLYDMTDEEVYKIFHIAEHEYNHSICCE